MRAIIRSESFSSGRWLIAGDDDLLILVDESFKGVAELFFKIEAILQELDIVDEEDVDIGAIEALHPVDGFVAQIIDEFIDKRFRRDALHAQFLVRREYGGRCYAEYAFSQALRRRG